MAYVLTRRALIPALFALGAGVALLGGGDRASETPDSPPPAVLADAQSLPKTAGTFGRGRLIRDASAGMMGKELVTAVAVEGRRNARRKLQFRVSSAGAWVTPRWPDMTVASRETFHLSARSEQEPCIVSIQRHAPTLRCLVRERWTTIGKPVSVPGVRSVNDVTERDGVIYATTGGTVKHRPVVQIIRWDRGGFKVLGQTEGWAAQRGYFLNTPASTGPVCGAYNRYSGPGTAQDAPFGTFCVRDGRVQRGLAPPSSFAKLAHSSLPAATSGPVKYDVEPSTVLTNGSWVISMVALGRSGAGTLVLKCTDDQWTVDPLTSEKPKVFPYGGVWSVGNNAFLLNSEAQPQINSEARSTVRRLDSGGVDLAEDLASVAEGYFVPLGVFSHDGQSYALVSESAPTRSAKVSASRLADAPVR